MHPASDRALRLWYGTVIAAFIAVVWLCRVFPTQDGATHAYNAIQLREVLSQANHAVFERTPGLTTNWTAHLLLMPLTAVLSAPAADRVLVTLLLLVSAWAWWRALRSTPHLLPFAIPMMFTSLLFFGFYSFVFGLAFLVVAVSDAPRRWLWLQLAWLSHPMCWGAALAACYADRPREWRRLAVEALPGGLCAMLFVSGMRSAPIASPPLFAAQWKDFFFGESPFTVVNVGFFLLSMLLVALLVLTALEHRRGSQARWLGGLALIFWLLWPLTPKATLTGSFVPGRILLLALMLTLLWLARQEKQPHVGVVGAVFATLILGLAAWRVLAVQPLYDEFLSLKSAGRTLVVRYTAQPENEPHVAGMDLFLNGGGWLAARDGSIDVTNYEATTPHFPLRFRAGFERGYTGDTDGEPPHIRLTPHPPDTIVLWGYAQKPAWLEGYAQVQRTPHGMVWRRQRSIE